VNHGERVQARRACEPGRVLVDRLLRTAGPAQDRLRVRGQGGDGGPGPQVGGRRHAAPQGRDRPRMDSYAAAEAKPLAERDGEGKIIGGHLADLYAALLAKGATAKYAGVLRTRAAVVLDKAGAKRVSELTPSRVQAAIAALRDSAWGWRRAITTWRPSRNCRAGCGATAGRGSTRLPT